MTTAESPAPYQHLTGVPAHESFALRPLEVVAVTHPVSGGRAVLTGSVVYLRGRIEIAAEVRDIVRRVMTR